MSSHPGRYPPDLRERAVRLVSERRPGYPSEWATIVAVAGSLGIRSPETLRKWVREAKLNDREQKPASRWVAFAKKSFFGAHPVITGAAAIVIGGLVLAYFQLALGIGKQKSSLVVDQVSVSPAGLRYPQSGSKTVIPFGIDIRLLNTGSQLAVINYARLVIRQFVKIPLCQSQGAFPPTGYYPSHMPLDPHQGTVVSIPVSQQVNPNGADRFDLLLKAPPWTHASYGAVYLYRVGIYLSYSLGAKPLYAGTVLVDLPFDIHDDGSYFWDRFYASHPSALNYWGRYKPGIERCLMKNSYVLHSILPRPATRTAPMAAIPPKLAYRQGSV